MSGFRLTLRQQPAGRLDMSGVDAARFAGMSAADVERAELSPGLRLKDVFSVAGSSGETLTIADFVRLYQRSADALPADTAPDSAQVL